jgi:hypothetical protein
MGWHSPHGMANFGAKILINFLLKLLLRRPDLVKTLHRLEEITPWNYKLALTATPPIWRT